MGDEIKVEQCDRDAAAAYWKVSRIGNSETQRRYLSGEADNALIVQAFARHRIQHGAQGEWQPMETAPKDGTFVQLFEPIAHPSVSVGCYDDEAGWLIGEADFMPSKCRPRCWAPLLPRPDIAPATKSESAPVSDIVDDRPVTPNPVVDHEAGNMSDKLRSAVECAQSGPDLATIAYMDGRKDMAAQLAERDAECFMLAAGACINPGQHGLVGDEHGNSVCTAHEALLAEEQAHSEALASLAERDAEVARLREALVAMEAQLAEAQREIERLRKALEPRWFYIDGWEEKCLFSINDAIDLADFEPGYHLLEVSTATPRPTIWCAVHVTDDDDVDDRFTFTEHASEADARAALEKKP